jgi:hypothetical protein
MAFTALISTKLEKTQQYCVRIFCVELGLNLPWNMESADYNSLTPSSNVQVSLSRFLRNSCLLDSL